MDRTQFLNNFSKRLHELLKNEGHLSTRSKAGIETSKLAKVAGVSYQMARKYALGLALPDYNIVPKIAKWLNVSPGWLLYGEEKSIAPDYQASSLIEIEFNVLKYILHKYTIFFPQTNDAEKIIDYTMSVIYDTSHIPADEKTLCMVIDMMLSFAIKLGEIKKQKIFTTGDCDSTIPDNIPVTFQF